MSRLQFPNGALPQQTATPVIDVAALQRPMVTPMNDVQVIAMVAASLDGNPEERVSLAEQLVLKSMERSYRFSKKLTAIRQALDAEMKADAPQG